jgi:anti-sigma factor RsiW
MLINENDFELLYSYLDGELPIPECEGLWRRLAVEPELTAELDRLRADLLTRQGAWSAMEPDDSTVSRVESSILRASRRYDIFSTLNRGVGFVASVAALILFGFTVGWMGRERIVPAAGPQNLQGTTVAAVSPRNGTARTNVRSVVDVLDSNGTVVARQMFDSPEEAQQFARDIQQVQANRQQSHESNIVPAAFDRF